MGAVWDLSHNYLQRVGLDAMHLNGLNKQFVADKDRVC